MTLAEHGERIVLDAELHELQSAEHIMSMPVAHCWTIEEVNRLIDEREQLTPRYELVDGELLVTPAPSDRHQRIIAELFLLLYPYVKRHRLGETRLGPGEARLTTSTHLEPDLFVVEGTNGRLPRLQEPILRLLLCIEVLSPGSARHDRIIKRRFFQRQGVPEYWVIDGEAETVEIWRPNDDRPELRDETLSWHAHAGVPPFELDLRAFFSSVADEPDNSRPDITP